MDEYPKVNITKLDTARFQLHTAIELWFSGGNPISIYTLAYSAHEIIDFLYKRKGLENLLFDTSLIRGKERNKLRDTLKAHASYMKHANKDPDAIHQLDTRANEVLILFAVTGVARMGEFLHTLEIAFQVWIWLHKPDWISGKITPDLFPVDSVAKLRAIPKREFIAAFKAFAAEQEAK